MRDNSTNSYTERGELMQAAATGTAGFTRQYASNREGMVISRRESSGTAQNYVYYQGGVVASVGNAALAELSSTLTPIWQNEFEASRPTSYVVGQGDTLSRIAQMVWGDSRMWYLIADANGLSQGANDVLQAGDNLKIPSVATSTQNNATTFKPYNPAEIIGDNTPSPNAPPPPPPPKKKCGGLATIIMVVVAVVAVVVTAGAAAVALGASGGLFAAGGAALAGGTLGSVSMGFGTALAASVIGGAVGSAVSQLTGMALGVVDKFSWRQVASAGLTTGALAGLGGFLNAAQPGSWGETAANALRQKNAIGYSLKGVFNYGTSQVANRVAGLSSSFSWRDLAATAAGAAVAGSIGDSSAFSGLKDLPRAIVTGQLGAFASAKIKDQWFGGGPINYGQVAADAFGNALGNYVVGQMGPKAAAPQSSQSQSGYTDFRLSRPLLSSGVDDASLDLAWLDDLNGSLSDATPLPEKYASQLWAAFNGDSATRSTDSPSLRERMQASKAISNASLAQREGNTVITGATLGWGAKNGSVFSGNKVSSVVAKSGSPRSGVISSLARDLVDNGTLSASLEWGNGWSGVSLNLSYNKDDGLTAYAGYGRALGASFTLVAGTSVGDSSGLMTSTFVSGGNGVFGATANINASTGGVEYFGGGGYGLGWAFGSTTGYQINISDMFSDDKK